MRIQKSLIIEFDKESAKDSALEDWKIDMERERIDAAGPNQASISKIIDVTTNTANTMNN
jgi:hypothetical protein